MKRTLLAGVLVSLMTGSAFGQARVSISPELLERRRVEALAAGTGVSATLLPPDATDADVLGALGLTSSVATAITRSGNSAAFGTFASLGVIKPITGTKFLAMSSGIAGTSSPQPGTDFPPTGAAGDQASLTLTLKVPAGATEMNFSYRFMSAEFPEYVGTQYNDFFSISSTTGTSSTTVARANVNTAKFYPASAATAGGSGYDIKNSSGSPDAGLTDWLPVSIPVTGGSSVTLTFTIADVGDGIYDSQALISALSFGSVELLNPNPDFLANTASGISTDPNLLALGGRAVRGLVADGVTPLLVRVAPAGGTTVRFTLLNASGTADGLLKPFTGGSATTDLTVSVVNTTSGPRAYAVFMAPDDFEKPGFEALSERTVKLRVTSGAGGSQTTNDTDIVIARPPVLFVHGIWSSKIVGWGAQALLTDPRFADRSHVMDYELTNAAHFTTNVAFLRAWVDATKQKLRDEPSRLAVTKIDIVAHSMGGILSRMYVTGSNYLRNDNYQQGDFNRVITLDSPHAGSPVANLAFSLSQSSVVGGMLVAGMKALKKPIDQGAVEDLREGSTALNIGAANVRGHAIAGTGGSDAVLAVGVAGTLADLASKVPQPPLSAAVFKVLWFSAKLIGLADSVIFGLQQHDFLVTVNSSRGGLPLTASTTYSGVDSIHWNNTSSTSYSDRIAQLLTTAPSNTAFAAFPANAGDFDAPTLSDTGPFVSPQAPAQDLTLSVLGSTNVTAGSTVTFTVVPNAGVTTSDVLLVGPDFAVEDSSAPFQFDVTVPTSWVGPFAVSALAADGSGNAITSNTLTLQVSTTATLQSIDLEPRDVRLNSIGGSLVLTATGSYSDKVTRQLNGLSSITFASSNTAAVKVDANGLLTAIGTGFATIRAVSGSVEDSISVTVNPFASDAAPVADGGPDQAVTPGTKVTLTGTAKGVSSGLTPTFEWSQVSGPSVSLSSTTTSTVTFTPSTSGTYLFSLIVRAGLSESIPDNVTVVVGSASPPVITSQPVDSTVNKGDTAVLIVTVSGVPTPAYQWRKNGASISGATSPSLVLSNVQTSDAGTYSVVASNASGTVTSNDAILTVQIAPGITVQPANQRVTIGGSATFTVAADGSPAPTFQWQVSTNGGSTWTDLTNTSIYSGVTTTTLTITGAPASLGNNRYRAVATNSGGAATSDAATLTVANFVDGDLDGDAKGDLLWRNTQAGDVAVWLMNGATVTQGPVIAPGVPLAWQIANIGDLDGDGKADLVWRHSQTGDLAVWLMNGVTVKQGPVIAAGVPLAWQTVGIGDLDGDGKADLIWRNTQTGDVAAWLMNGAAVKSSPIVAAGVPLVWQIVKVGDLDGDGNADLIWRNTQSGDVAVWLMNGATVKQGPVIAPGVPLAWQIVGVGDLDGDGKADLIWRNNASGDVSAWLMNGATVTQGPVIAGGVPLSWQIAVIRDVDGDGKVDIIWRNNTSGDVAAWLMNGATVKQQPIVASGVPLAWQIQK